MRRREYNRGSAGYVVRTEFNQFDFVPRTDEDDASYTILDANDVDLTGVVNDDLLKWNTGKMVKGPAISTDGTLGGTGALGSDAKIPTEKAVKQYLSDFINGYDYQDSILDQLNFVTSEPATPAEGDRYISTATGTSSVTFQSVVANHIYEFNSLGAWTDTTPNPGFYVYDESIPGFILFTGSSWIDVPHLSMSDVILTGAINAGETARAPTHSAVSSALDGKLSISGGLLDAPTNSTTAALKSNYFFSQVIGELVNLGFSMSGTVLTLKGASGASLSTSNPGFVRVSHQSTPAVSVWVPITSDISITLPSSISPFDVLAQVSSSLPFFVYLFIDSGTPYIGVSRYSDIYTVIPSAPYYNPYCHTMSANTATQVNTATARNFGVSKLSALSSSIYPRLIGRVNVTTASTAGYYSNIGLATGFFFPMASTDILGKLGPDVETKRGVIGTASTIGDFLTVQNWQGSGPYTCEIEHGYGLTNGDEFTISCFVSNIKVQPSQIEVVTASKIKITSSTNSNMVVVMQA